MSIALSPQQRLRIETNRATAQLRIGAHEAELAHEAIYSEKEERLSKEEEKYLEYVERYRDASTMTEILRSDASKVGAETLTLELWESEIECTKKGSWSMAQEVKLVEQDHGEKNNSDREEEQKPSILIRMQDLDLRKKRQRPADENLERERSTKKRKDQDATGKKKKMPTWMALMVRFC